jgi:hypothetical protein
MYEGPSMEWMEMDARTIHFHAVDTWTVDVEWVAGLVYLCMEGFTDLHLLGTLSQKGTSDRPLCKYAIL